MTVDERVGAALRDLATTITPLPDPAGRAYTRLRRSRRRRRTAAGFMAVVAIVAAVLAPHAAGSPQRWDATSEWTLRMTSEPRGPLARDAAFVADLTWQMTLRVRDSEFAVLNKRAYHAADLVFAGDVGERRVVLLALEAAGSSRPDALWLSAPAGASAAELTGRHGLRVFSEGLQPLEIGHLDGLTIAVAPAGCEFETAVLPRLNPWHPEPTQSYLVRTPQTALPEWWRVECDGVVRVERPSMAPRSFDVPKHIPITADQYRAAALSFGSEVYDAPSVVWAGSVPGTTGETTVEGKGALFSAQLVGGFWKNSLRILIEQRPGGGGYELDTQFTTTADPADPNRFIAVQPSDDGQPVIVFAPAKAAKVRAVAGTTRTDEAPVAGGVALLTSADAGTVYEALDRSGTVIARTEAVTPGAVVGRSWIDNWDGPAPAE